RARTEQHDARETFAVNFSHGGAEALQDRIIKSRCRHAQQCSAFSPQIPCWFSWQGAFHIGFLRAVNLSERPARFDPTNAQGFECVEITPVPGGVDARNPALSH